MPHNGMRIPTAFLDTLASAGFSHLFLLADTSLHDSANAMLSRAHERGMQIFLGHCEGQPDQDYWVQTRGNRWKYHPEDTIQCPRMSTRVGEAVDDDLPTDIDAHSEASIYSPSDRRDAWHVLNNAVGTIIDTLLIRPELMPDHGLTLRPRAHLDTEGSTTHIA